MSEPLTGGVVPGRPWGAGVWAEGPKIAVFGPRPTRALGRFQGSAGKAGWRQSPSSTRRVFFKESSKP